MADEAGDAPAPVEEVEMSVLDALKEVSGLFRVLEDPVPTVITSSWNFISLNFSLL